LAKIGGSEVLLTQSLRLRRWRSSTSCRNNHCLGRNTKRFVRELPDQLVSVD